MLNYIVMINRMSCPEDCCPCDVSKKRKISQDNPRRLTDDKLPPINPRLMFDDEEIIHPRDPVSLKRTLDDGDIPNVKRPKLDLKRRLEDGEIPSSKRSKVNQDEIAERRVDNIKPKRLELKKITKLSNKVRNAFKRMLGQTRHPRSVLDIIEKHMKDCIIVGQSDLLKELHDGKLMENDLISLLK
jgi:hypothetical protein